MLEIAEFIPPNPNSVWKLAKQAGVDLAVAGLLGGGAFFLTAHLLRVQEPALAWHRARGWWQAARPRFTSRR